VKLSDIMSQNDWAYVNEVCIPNNVNPKLIAAIGWHETHWGRLGMGKYGFHLGVSCWVRGDTLYKRDKEKGLVDEETYRKVSSGHLYCSTTYKGMGKQVLWAVNKFSGRVPYQLGYPDVLDIAENIWKPGNPKAWAESVWKIYSSLEIDMAPVYQPSEPETIPIEDNDLPSATGILEKISYYLEQIAKLLKEWRM